MHKLSNTYNIRKSDNILTAGYCMPSFYAEPSKDWHFRPEEGYRGS